MKTAFFNVRQWLGLLAATVLVPVTFYLYTEFNNPRMRCHIPSWRYPDHFAFELIPYVVIALVLVGSWFLSVRAMKSTDSIGQALLVVTIAFEYSVFLFAIIYYQYGLTISYDQEDLFIANTYVNSLIYQGQGELAEIIAAPDKRVAPPPLDQILLNPRAYWQDGLTQEGALVFGDRVLQFTEGPEITHPIENNRWDYLRFSLNVALPGVPPPNLKACPSAEHFQIGQVFWGLVLGAIAIYLATRIGKDAESVLHAQRVEETADSSMLVERVFRGHEPDIFDVHSRSISSASKRRNNLRSVRARLNRR